MKRVKIEQAISEAGLKKKYVAEQLGINECYLSAYLSKPNNITVEKASIICKLVGRKMDELDFGQSNFFADKLQKN